MSVLVLLLHSLRKQGFHLPSNLQPEFHNGQPRSSSVGLKHEPAEAFSCFLRVCVQGSVMSHVVFITYPPYTVTGRGQWASLPQETVPALIEFQGHLNRESGDGVWLFLTPGYLLPSLQTGREWEWGTILTSCPQASVCVPFVRFGDLENKTWLSLAVSILGQAGNLQVMLSNPLIF